LGQCRGIAAGILDQSCYCAPSFTGAVCGIEIVVAVLAAIREGASINAAAKAAGINYRTAQRIVEGGEKYRRRQLAAVG
jgi:molybdenum-dependent DNA-binding transcriptional regulator ModE